MFGDSHVFGQALPSISEIVEARTVWSLIDNVDSYSKFIQGNASTIRQIARTLFQDTGATKKHLKFISAKYNPEIIEKLNTIDSIVTSIHNKAEQVSKRVASLKTLYGKNRKEISYGV